jgi:hypothetical protein
MKVNNSALYNEQNQIKYRYVCLKAFSRKQSKYEKGNIRMLRNLQITAVLPFATVIFTITIHHYFPLF